MTRNLGTPTWLWLSNSTISKFCNLSYMVIICPNLKVLLWLTMEFFRIDMLYFILFFIIFYFYFFFNYFFGDR